MDFNVDEYLRDLLKSSNRQSEEGVSGMYTKREIYCIDERTQEIEPKAVGAIGVDYQEMSDDEFKSRLRDVVELRRYIKAVRVSLKKDEEKYRTKYGEESTAQFLRDTFSMFEKVVYFQDFMNDIWIDRIIVSGEIDIEKIASIKRHGWRKLMNNVRDNGHVGLYTREYITSVLADIEQRDTKNPEYIKQLSLLKLENVIESIYDKEEELDRIIYSLAERRKEYEDRSKEKNIERYGEMYSKERIEKEAKKEIDQLLGEAYLAETRMLHFAKLYVYAIYRKKQHGEI